MRRDTSGFKDNFKMIIYGKTDVTFKLHHLSNTKWCLIILKYMKTLIHVWLIKRQSVGMHT